MRAISLLRSGVSALLRANAPFWPPKATERDRVRVLALVSVFPIFDSARGDICDQLG